MWNSIQIRFIPLFRICYSSIYIILIFLSFPLFCFSYSSQNLDGLSLPPINLIEEPDSFININENIGVYVTSEKDINWEEIYDSIPKSDLIPVQSIPNYGKFRQSKYAYWLYFKVKTSESFESQTLYLKTKSRGNIDLYQFSDSQLIDHVQNGYYVKKEDYGQPLLLHDRYALPVHLDYGRDYEFILKLESSSTFSRQFDVLIFSSNYTFKEVENKTHFVYFLFGGFFISLISMSLFAILVYFFNRDKSFLFYFLYNISIIVFYLRAFSIHNPRWFILPVFIHKYWCYLPLLLSIYFFYTLFLMYFLDARSKYPSLYRYMQLFLWTLLSIFLLDRLFIIIDISWSSIFVYYSRLLIHIITFFFLLFLLFKIRDKLALFVFIGSTILMVSLILGQIIGLNIHYIAGFIKSSDLPMYLGIVLESVCFFLGLGYKYHLSEKEKNMAEASLLLKEKEAEHLVEQEKLKSDIYTNITHEIRTPLTIIMGAAQQIDQEKDGNKIKNYTASIQKYCQKLILLINKILELSKLESGKMKLKLIQSDVILFIKYLVLSLQPLAQKQNIDLIFYNESSEIIIDFDPEKLESIITNLISNAIKHSSSEKKVFIHVKTEENHLVIKVKDQGVGIPEDHLDLIFNKFHQATTEYSNQKGTGIGLSLVKEYIDLMKGSIHVKSVIGEGATFEIKLPISNQAEINTSFDLQPHYEKTPPTNHVIEHKILDKNTPLILLVEDNLDILKYLISCLGNYNLIHATDGKTGLELALDNIPDLIISDILMPEVDGFEFCEKIKSDPHTDHIPVILLTAKADHNDKLYGFSKGADAYITKPFSTAELLSRIEQLIEGRRKILDKVKQSGLEAFLNERNQDAVSLFMNKAIVIIQENMNKPIFGPPLFAQKMGMSESKLYKKLKATTGKSTAIFIRSVKLQKAKALLLSTNHSISQIAYDTGFQDPSWFSRAFKKEFGYAPSEIEKHNN